MTELQKRTYQLQQFRRDALLIPASTEAELERNDLLDKRFEFLVEAERIRESVKGGFRMSRFKIKPNGKNTFFYKWDSLFREILHEIGEHEKAMLDYIDERIKQSESVTAE